MDSLQNYKSSSSGESDSDNEDKKAHLKPIDTHFSVAASLIVQAAPAVVPVVSAANFSFIGDHRVKTTTTIMLSFQFRVQPMYLEPLIRKQRK